MFQQFLLFKQFMDAQAAAGGAAAPVAAAAAAPAAGVPRGPTGPAAPWTHPNLTSNVLANPVQSALHALTRVIPSGGTNRLLHTLICGIVREHPERLTAIGTGQPHSDVDGVRTYISMNVEILRSDAGTPVFVKLHFYGGARNGRFITRSLDAFFYGQKYANIALFDPPQASTASGGGGGGGGDAASLPSYDDVPY